MDFENNRLYKLAAGTIAFSIFFIIACLSVFFFLPYDSKKHQENLILTHTYSQNSNDNFSDEFYFEDDFAEVSINVTKKEDSGLVLYSQPQSKIAVEWFYTQVTNSSEVAEAILENAEINRIPLSLAFALAYTESQFKANAMHKNTNGTTDRGLFQLNDASFPKLSEADFYDPKISAKYGLAHFKFCLDAAGNEVAALAMYNAGTGKVRKNNTPQITLNYISKIQNYRNALEENFATEVLALYNSDFHQKVLAKK